MEVLGTKWEAGKGHTVADLEAFQAVLAAKGAKTNLVIMEQSVPSLLGKERAAVLVWKGGVETLLGAGGAEALFKEQSAIPKDTKAKMRGRVVNKRARYNLCFDKKGHAPDYEAGKGTVIAYDDVPLTKRLVESLELQFEVASGSLIAEGNYYYDLKKCGIGFHGDTERRVVYAARIGSPEVSMPLHFQWFHKFEPVGERIVIPLENGDVYVMSEKAVGADWKSSSKFTLRHATGCSAFTTIKPKKEGTVATVATAATVAAVAAVAAVGGAGGPSTHASTT